MGRQTTKAEVHLDQIQKYDSKSVEKEKEKEEKRKRDDKRKEDEKRKEESKKSQRTAEEKRRNENAEILRHLKEIKEQQEASKNQIDSIVNRVQVLEENNRAEMMIDNEEEDRMSLESEDELENYNPHYMSPSEDEEVIEDDEELAEVMQQFEEIKETSGPVNQKLADFVNRGFKNGIKDEAFNKIISDEKPKKPENCTSLQVIKTNTVVWKAIPVKSKKVDIKLQDVSRAAVFGATWLTQAIDEMIVLQKNLKKNNKENQEIEPIIKKCNLSLQMFAQTNYRTNMIRRELIRPVLSPQYRDLCGVNTTMTEELFGDNISKTVADLESQGKITLKMSRKIVGKRKNFRGGFNNNYHHPYPKPYQGQWNQNKNYQGFYGFKRPQNPKNENWEKKKNYNKNQKRQ